MKQAYNWAMDQVKLSPQAEKRILNTLEIHLQTPHPKRWRGAVIAALAGAAAMLMGAAAVWQSGLFQYFQGPGGSEVSDLSQYTQPVQVSGVSEDGWTLTVEECMGDDQWVFLWLTLTAPEGTELPVLGEGDSFYVNVSVPGLGMDKLQVYDLVPGDSRLQIAAGLHAGRDLRGGTISLRVSQIQYRPKESGELIFLQNGTFEVDEILLDYPNTVTCTQPMLPIPGFGAGALLTELTVTPFTVLTELEGQRPEETDLSLSVSMRDGTAWDLTPVAVESAQGASNRWTVSWDYRLEPLRPGAWDESFLLDPAQIASLTLNGVAVPFSFDP